MLPAHARRSAGVPRSQQKGERVPGSFSQMGTATAVVGFGGGTVPCTYPSPKT